MSDKIDLIYQKLHDSQERFSYYILGITVVAIGFIIVNNPVIKLEAQNIPLGISIALLASSFLLGLRAIEYVNSTLYANFELLKIESGTHPDVPNQEDYRNAAAEGVKSAIGKNSKKIQTFGSWENRLLILGLLIYFVNIVVKSM